MVKPASHGTHACARVQVGSSGPAPVAGGLVFFSRSLRSGVFFTLAYGYILLLAFVSSRRNPDGSTSSQPHWYIVRLARGGVAAAGAAAAPETLAVATYFGLLEVTEATFYTQKIDAIQLL